MGVDREATYSTWGERASGKNGRAGRGRECGFCSEAHSVPPASQLSPLLDPADSWEWFQDNVPITCLLEGIVALDLESVLLEIFEVNWRARRFLPVLKSAITKLCDFRQVPGSLCCAMRGSSWA